MMMNGAEGVCKRRKGPIARVTRVRRRRVARSLTFHVAATIRKLRRQRGQRRGGRQRR